VISKTSVSLTLTYREPVGVSVAKVESVTLGVCVAVLGNKDVIKPWTKSAITIDCPVRLFGVHCKPPRRDVVRSLERENETPLAVADLEEVLAIPFPHEQFQRHRRKPAEDAPLCVQNHGQCVCVAAQASPFKPIAGILRRSPEKTK
jgi:hypothetical protein